MKKKTKTKTSENGSLLQQNGTVLFAIGVWKHWFCTKTVFFFILSRLGVKFNVKPCEKWQNPCLGVFSWRKLKLALKGIFLKHMFIHVYTNICECSLPGLEVLWWYLNRPVSHSARHQHPARERHIMRIASRENVDNQAPRNTNFTQ